MQAIVLAVVLTALIVGSGTFFLLPNIVQPSAVTVTQTAKVDDLPFVFDYRPQGRYAPLFLALDKGFYGDVNVLPHFIAGSGSVAAVTAVDQGQALMGDADGTVLPTARAKGAKVVYVGAMVDKSLGGFGYLTTTGIKTPQDFAGKKVWIDPKITTWVLFPAFLKVNGVDPSKVDLRSASSALEVILVLKGDIAPLWYDTNWISLQNEAQKQGVQVEFMFYKDWGFDFPGHTYIASEKLVKENPDLIKRFLFATYRGVLYARENPEEAVQILRKYYPELDQATALGQWKESLKFQWNDAYKTKGWGYVDPDSVQKMV